MKYLTISHSDSCNKYYLSLKEYIAIYISKCERNAEKQYITVYRLNLF